MSRAIALANPANLAFNRYEAQDLTLGPSNLKPAERLVFCVIVRHVNPKTGACFPGVDTIAQCTGVSRRTVIRALQSLTLRGILRAEHSRAPGDAKNGPNSYTVRLEPLRAAAAEGKRAGRHLRAVRSDGKPAEQSATMAPCSDPQAGCQNSPSKVPNRPEQGATMTPDLLIDPLKETERESAGACTHEPSPASQLFEGFKPESLPPPSVATPAPRLSLVPSPPASSSADEGEQGPPPAPRPVTLESNPESRAVADLWAVWCVAHREIYPRADAPKRDDEALRSLLTVEAEKHASGLELAARVRLCSAVLRGWLRKPGGNGFLTSEKHALRYLRSEKSLDTLFTEALSAEREAGERRARDSFFAGVRAEARTEDRQATDADQAAGAAAAAQALAALGIPPPSATAERAQMRRETAARAGEFAQELERGTLPPASRPPPPSARIVAAPPAPPSGETPTTPLAGPPGPVKVKPGPFRVFSAAE